MQNRPDFLTQRVEFPVDVLVVPARQVIQIFGIAVVPVDCRIVTGIRQRLIQRPETAHKPLGILGDRLREVRALRRNRADNRDGTLSSV